MRLFRDGEKCETISLALGLDLPDRTIVSIYGAGGKTSLLFALAKELAEAGRRVAVTTTTHMFRPDRASRVNMKLPAGPVCPDFAWTMSDDPDEVRRLCHQHDLLMAVRPSKDHPDKAEQPCGAVWDLLREEMDILLVEADGSRRMPLKWPAPWEPVIPEDGMVTICVAGLSGLGRKISLTIYRGDEMLEYANSLSGRKLPEESNPAWQGMLLPAGDAAAGEEISGGDLFVTEEMLAAILSSPDGGLKGSAACHRVFLNQADTSEKREAAERILVSLKEKGIYGAYGSLFPEAKGRLP